MGNARVEPRLGLGHEVSVTRAVSECRECRAMAKRLIDLESNLATG